MRNFILLTVLVSIMMISCYYDHPPEPLPIDPDQVSFATHILPILQKSCSTANCHDGTQAPDLRDDVAYRNLVAGGFVNLVLPEASPLYRSVDFVEAPMPPGGPKLAQLDIDLILIWIQKGAPND